MNEVTWSEAKAVLERVPGTLTSLLAGLAPAWSTCTEGPDTFSPRDVVAHLADLEATDWVPRIRRILEHGAEVPFDPVDPFAFRTWSSDLPLEHLLAEFDQRRRANLEVMDDIGLGADAMAKAGLHPALGPVRLGQLLATWVVHDLTHVAQIARVMAKRYAETVGPWETYLSVLHDRTGGGTT